MEYTIKQIQKRDEWTFQGNHMQDFAMTLEGDDRGWIKLTQKYETPAPLAGSTINGLIERKTTKNGNEYWKFKKVTPGFEDRQSGGRSGGNSIKQEDIDYIILMLEEMTLRRPAPDSPKPRNESSKETGESDLDDPFAGLL